MNANGESARMGAACEKLVEIGNLLADGDTEIAERLELKASYVKKADVEFRTRFVLSVELLADVIDLLAGKVLPAE